MHISWVSAFPASYQNTFITNLLSITIMIWHLLIVTTARTQLVARPYHTIATPTCQTGFGFDVVIANRSINKSTEATGILLVARRNRIYKDCVRSTMIFICFRRRLMRRRWMVGWLLVQSNWSVIVVGIFVRRITTLLLHLVNNIVYNRKFTQSIIQHPSERWRTWILLDEPKRHSWRHLQPTDGRMMLNLLLDRGHFKEPYPSSRVRPPHTALYVSSFMAPHATCCIEFWGFWNKLQVQTALYYWLGGGRRMVASDREGIHGRLPPLQSWVWIPSMRFMFYSNGRFEQYESTSALSSESYTLPHSLPWLLRMINTTSPTARPAPVI